MQELHAGYLVIGLVILVLAIGAERIHQRWWLSAPLIAVALGIAIGPHGLGLADPRAWGSSRRVLEELARVTLGFSLMTVAFRLPRRYVWEHRRSLGILLGAGMLGMWLIAAALGRWALGLGWLEALLVAAVITPTDPVAAASIVTGDLAERGLSARVRHLLSAESGANDGLAYLLVMLPILLMHRAPGDALLHWLWRDLVVGVLGGIAFGAAIGWLVGRFLARREDRAVEGGSPLLAVTIALVLVLLGSALLLHVDGILAVFAAGLVLNTQMSGDVQARHHEIQEVLKRFIEVPVFVYFGLVLPWAAWGELGVVGVAFAVAVVIVRRLPVLLALKPLLPEVHSWREAFLLGWFGPVAVAAMVYAAWAELHGGAGPVWTVSSLVILCSVILHGLTATPLTRWSARRVERGEAARAHPGEAPHPA